MSLKGKKRQVITKMMGKGAKITWAEDDEEAEKHFKQLLKLRKEYRELGGKFKKRRNRGD